MYRASVIHCSGPTEALPYRLLDANQLMPEVEIRVNLYF